MVTRIKEMVTNREVLRERWFLSCHKHGTKKKFFELVDHYHNSLCQCLVKFIENIIERMHTDVRL